MQQVLAHDLDVCICIVVSATTLYLMLHFYMWDPLRYGPAWILCETHTLSGMILMHKQLDIRTQPQRGAGNEPLGRSGLAKPVLRRLTEPLPLFELT